jgi:uncharacterized SAM-binding protein YcdF (DUF218 family)
MAPIEKAAKKSHRRICTAIFLVLLISSVVSFRGVGRWLVREDPLKHADVIVVLSGSMPYRAEEAGKIFREGYAPEIWVSRPESPAGDLREFGVSFVGEEDYNRQILIHVGVPDQAIHMLPEAIVDTEQEVEVVEREMQREGKTSVIIVTSPPHTRRVKALWRKLVGHNPEMIVRAAREDPFDQDHWWRNTRDTFAVVREVLGLLNVLAGLPVRPHSPGGPAH